ILFRKANRRPGQQSRIDIVDRLRRQTDRLQGPRTCRIATVLEAYRSRRLPRWAATHEPVGFAFGPGPGRGPVRGRVRNLLVSRAEAFGPAEWARRRAWPLLAFARRLVACAEFG